MLQDLWDALIDFSARFIVPDWDSLVALIPLALLALVLLYVVWATLRFATAGPRRRGVARIQPLPPAGVHAPHPSLAPFLGAVGASLFVFGLLVGGLAFFLGIVALLVTLLYWGREALAEYDHLPDLATPEGALVPVAAPRSPPPGVHIPPPSFRPLLVSIAMTILVAGLVTGGWLLLVGFVALVGTTLGWLRDARHEYRAVVRADTTGHLDSGPAPGWPIGTFAILVVLVAGAAILGSGILPIGSGDEAAGGGAVPSGAPGGTGPPPPSGPALPAADVTISAENTQFLEQSVNAPADREFTIAFDNRDTVPHNVEIKQEGAGAVFTGEIVTGPTVEVYTVPPLAAGTYPFVCTVHPNMTGTLTAG